MDHVRIDEGIKRGRRLKVKPSDMERKTRNEAGQFLTRYSPELKQQALETALVALEAGARVEQVASQYSIPVSTLYSWLMGDPRAEKLRTQFYDGQAARNLVEIRAAKSPLELACAREELSGWIKVAERRDPRSWAPKQDVHVTGTVTIANALQGISERRQAQINSNQIIDLPSDAVHQLDSTESQPE